MAGLLRVRVSDDGSGGARLEKARRPGRAHRAGQDRGRQAAGHQPAPRPHRGHCRAGRPTPDRTGVPDADCDRRGLGSSPGGPGRDPADRGHEVVAAVGNAEDLRAAVDEHQPDAALVDVRMPPGYTDEGLRAAIAIRRDHPATGALVLAVHRDPVCGADLLGAASGGGAAGVGYLAQGPGCRRSGQFVEALSRVAAGVTALDPEVVTQLLGASRCTDGLGSLTARERDVLGLMAEGRSNGAIAGILVIPSGRWKSTSATSSANSAWPPPTPTTAGACRPPRPGVRPATPGSRLRRCRSSMVRGRYVSR